MTDMNGTTPSGAPMPPVGDDHAHQAPPQPVQPTQPAQTAQTYYYQQSQPQQHAGTVTYEKKSHGLRTFLLAFAGALLACALAFGAFGIFNAVTGAASGNAGKDNNGGPSDSGSSTVLGSQDSSSTSGDEDENLTLPESVAKKCLPSVAAIDVYTSQSAMSGMYGYGNGAGSGDSGTLTQSSLGSGVVLTEDGYIITNYHVVEGGEAFKVTIEGEQYDADVVGADPQL